ncbi:MAG: hypothetical protein P0120_18855 [Nitrospira sp.]|nr:hypothetical protein [Nitrospira sp.]
MLRSLLFAGALLTSIAMLPLSSLAQTSGSVTWNEWTFTYEVSGKFDGLSLKGVQYKGFPFIYKLSFPVMRVFYTDNVCGPYADRLGGALSPIPWANNAKVAKREFTLNGRQWYEIGIRDVIGHYDIYQVYYLSADGILDAHVYSKGLQCVMDHVHYPNWRIDFDIQGGSNDQILQNTSSGYQVKPIEFDAKVTDALNNAWRVRGSGTNSYVDVLPGFTDFTIPDQTTDPVSGSANNTVFGRLYRSSEDTGWTYGPKVQVPYNNGEAIDGKDLVFWYEGYLPHSAAEGSELWHSTGLRLAVMCDDGSSGPCPTTGAASFTLGASPTHVTVAAGNSGTTTLTVTPDAGFNQPVSFSCGGLPVGAACNFTPATVTPAGGPVATTLTITTKSGPAAALSPGRIATLVASLVTPVLLMPLGGLIRRRGVDGRVLSLLAGGVMVLALAGLWSCSGSESTPPPATTSGGGGASATGTPASTSTVAVTGSSASGNSTVPITLTVTR